MGTRTPVSHETSYSTLLTGRFRFCGLPISCGSVDFNRERSEDRKRWLAYGQANVAGFVRNRLRQMSTGSPVSHETSYSTFLTGRFRFCGLPISWGSVDFNRERFEDRKRLARLRASKCSWFRQKPAAPDEYWKSERSEDRKRWRA
jgi:hypothetical protein